VVEEVTRQPFAEFMRVNILEPFGMKSSRFVWDGAYARRVATPHDKTGKPIETKPKTASEMAADLAVYGAAASLSTTPADYARFLLEILDPKPADAFRLDESSRREYLRPQFKRDEISSSSLGWVVAQFNGLTSFTHAGSAAGWNCESFASTDRKSGIVIMTNGDSFQPFRAEVGLGVLHASLRRPVIQSHPPPDRTPGALFRSTLPPGRQDRCSCAPTPARVPCEVRSRRSG
jgi:CubicO group peptidase (beta-lactamase class C family)